MVEGLSRSRTFAMMARNATPTTTSENTALPPNTSSGSGPVGTVSNMRHRSENTMMENMSFPTPSGTARRETAGVATAALEPAFSSSPSPALAGAGARAPFQSTPVRLPWNSSSPKESRGTTMKLMKLACAAESATTTAVTMAAAGEAKAANSTLCEAKRSPQSTCSGPAPKPPTMSPAAISGSL